MLQQVCEYISRTGVIQFAGGNPLEQSPKLVRRNGKFVDLELPIVHRSHHVLLDPGTRAFAVAGYARLPLEVFDHVATLVDDHIGIVGFDVVLALQSLASFGRQFTERLRGPLRFARAANEPAANRDRESSDNRLTLLSHAAGRSVPAASSQPRVVFGSSSIVLPVSSQSSYCRSTS